MHATTAHRISIRWRATRPLFFTAVLLAFSGRLAASQRLPFVVTIVDWDREVLERQRRAFRSDAREHEVLFCVEAWARSAVDNGLERIVIRSLRQERIGRAHRISDVGARCVDKDGKALPMLHTHADGNCQFSPSDLITAVARAAPFEGVQCGERHFIWTFSWQIVAIATSVETEQFRRAAATPRSR